jgi:membrane associated rhomboid family serine protease
MTGYLSPEDQRPLTNWGRLPVFAATILTAAYAAGLILSVVLASARIDLTRFAFIPPAFLGGALWQPITYSFIDTPSFFTPLGLLCLYSWGLEIERYLGRTRFLKLYALLIVVQPLVACLWWWSSRTPQAVAGNYPLLAGVLIAFATLYPNIEFVGWIPLKWFAFACFTMGSLMYLPDHNWPALSVLWVVCACAFGYVRFLQRGGTVELPRPVRALFRRRPKFSVVQPRPSRRGAPAADAADSVDPLLDKIAKSGIASLTTKERATLERAREALLKKEPDRR